MRFTLIIVVLYGCFLSLSNAGIAAERTIDRTISVTGVAAVVSVPDQLQFTIQVEQRGAEPEQLQKEVDRIATNIVSILKQAQISERQIQSMHMTLYPRHEYDKGKRISTEYILGRSIRVTHNDFTIYSALLTQLVKAGATSISPAQLSVSQPEKAYEQALNQAVINAKEKAAKLLAPLQQQVGDVLTVVEQSHYAAPKMMQARADVMESQALNMPGETQTRARVQVSFRIEN